MAAKHIIAVLAVLLVALSIATVVLIALTFVKADKCGNNEGNPNSPTSSTSEEPTTSTMSTSISTTSPSTASSASPTTTAPPAVGNSTGWNDAAQLLLAAMNQSVDPCDDFFEFACGKWNADHPLVDTDSLYIYNYIQQNIDTQIAHSIDASSGGGVRSRAMNDTVTFYEICKNDLRNNVSYNKEFVDLLDNLMGGWPIITPNWTLRLSVTLENLLATAVRDYGVNPFLTGTTMVDAKDVSRHSILIDQGDLGLVAPAYYTDPTIDPEKVNDYKSLINQTAQELNNLIDIGDIDKDITAIFALETELAKIMIPNAERRNHTAQYNPMSVSQLQTSYSMGISFKWLSYLDTLFNEVQGYTVSDDTMVIVDEPGYMDNITNIMKPAAMRDVANLIGWRIYMALQTAVNIQSTNGQHAKVTKSEYRESEKLAPEESTCGSFLVTTMPWTVGRLYTENYFNEAERNAVMDLTQGVIEAFREMLKVLDWLDEPSTKNATFKLSNLAQNYGWNDWIYNNILLDGYYDGLKIDGSQSLYDAYSAVLKFFQYTNLRKVINSVNRHDFQMSPALVNAWYEPTYNSITIPAAITQPPEFRIDFPQAFNYGATGNTPGHEITHGYDDEGVQYYEKGQLFTFMDQESQTGFRNMADCVVKEYSGFITPVGPLNGETNQGENIADNGGIRSAYAAYQQYVRINGEEPRLPGLEKYTMEQIYFLGFGYSWCGQESDEHLRKRILTDPHSPPKYRVLGTLRNFPEFGRAFSCPVKSGTMNPPDNERCFVWANAPTGS